MSASDARVLVVDDDRALLSTLIDFLEHYGYDVEATTDSREAEQLLKSKHYDAVLLDVVMPGLTGHGLLEATADLPDRPPVVMMSGPGSLDDAVEGFRRGVSDFVSKPFSAHAIVGSIQRAISCRHDAAARAQELTRALTAAGMKSGAPGRAEASNRTFEQLKSVLQDGALGLPAPEPLIVGLTQRFENHDLNTEELLGFLEKLPQGAAMVLRLARTPMYARNHAGPVSLREAIQRLGTRNAANSLRSSLISDSTLLRRGPSFKVAQRLWQNTVTTAAVARLLAQSAELVEPEEAFVIGLFHNIGDLLILRLCMELEASGDARVSTDEVLELAMYRHPDFGGFLCKAWNLDGLTTQVALRHHEYDVYAPGFEDAALQTRSALVVLANHIARAALPDSLLAYPDFPAADACQRILNLTDSQMTAIRSDAEQIAGELNTYLRSGQIPPS